MEGSVKRSCADCAVTSCDGHENRGYPPFCPTADLAPETRSALMAAYEEPETLRMMQNAALVELEGYCKWTRVQEIMEFARRMGYTHLGIATCVGLMRESRILAEILRAGGFTVTGMGCKVGAVPKVSMGIDPACEEIGPNLCNPILQAALLAEAGAELNIVMGLCVGHDSLFYRHSKAPVTTLVTKDRVTGHNPAAVLYTANSYYSSLKGDME